MPSFNNLKELEEVLQKQMIESVSNTMAEECKDIIRDYIETTVYSKEPKVYKRTYDLLNSLRVVPSSYRGLPGVEIFIDDDELHSGETAWYNAPQFGIKKGDRLTLAQVAKAVETKVSNPVSDDTEFWEKSMDYLKGVNFFIGEFIKELKRKGIVIK